MVPLLEVWKLTVLLIDAQLPHLTKHWRKEAMAVSLAE